MALDWQAVVISILGAGGLVQFIIAIRDWRQGQEVREAEHEEKYTVRLEKRVERLEFELAIEREYANMLVNALIEAGIKVPRRADIVEGRK